MFLADRLYLLFYYTVQRYYTAFQISYPIKHPTLKCELTRE